MWITYIIGFLTIFFIIIYKASKKKTYITTRFSVLIRLLLKLDKDLVIENKGKDDLTLFSSNIRGSITIFFVQYYGVISIIIEFNTIENSIQKKEWIFLDNMNQYLIFNHIVNDIQSFSKTSFNQNTINKLVDKSNHTIQNTVLTNAYSSFNIAQSFFCIAFIGIEKINKFQKTSSKGYFEILFFNCLITLEKSDMKQQNQLWDQLVILLVFYLENHNLMNQIQDIESLLGDRLAMYSEEIQLIKSNPNHNYNILYHYFFLKPLKLHSKIKHKVVQNSSLSKTIQSAGFSKAVLFMIADIEEKLPILQNLFI
jgi:hypothetical protein